MGYLTNVDYRGAGYLFHTLCCDECYPTMAAKHGQFASYGKILVGTCDYCGKTIPDNAKKTKPLVGETKLLHQAIEGDNECKYCGKPIWKWEPGEECRTRKWETPNAD